MNITKTTQAIQTYNLTGTGTSICVLDTGYNQKADPQTQNTIIGWNVLENNSNITDEHGHGTKITWPITQIANETTLLIAKVIQTNGIAYSSDIIAGLEWCETQNTDIISLSLGSGNYSGYCDEDIVAQKINEIGKQTFAASGNDGFTNSITSPACASTAIAIGSSTKTDQISEFTNYNSKLNIVSPGESILTKDKNGNSIIVSGTSMSTPIVAAISSLINTPNETTIIQTGDIIEHNKKKFLRINTLNLITNNITNNITLTNLTTQNGTEENYTPQAFECTTGSLSTTCYVSGSTTPTTTIAGTGNLVVQSGGNINRASNTITINMTGNVTVESGGTITTKGANGASGNNPGGAGGAITIQGDTVTIAGTVTSAGGNGGAGSFGPGGAGGAGGTITTYSNTFNNTATITSSGGKGGDGTAWGIGGTGGSAGIITINYNQENYISGTINAIGGAGGDQAATQAAGNAGPGAYIHLTTNYLSSTNLIIQSGAQINSYGGAGGSGGGSAYATGTGNYSGFIEIIGTNISIAGTVNADGGDNIGCGGSGWCPAGKAGTGGDITITGINTIISGSLTSIGGEGSYSQYGTCGTRGDGGTITLNGDILNLGSSTVDARKGAENGCLTPGNDGTNDFNYITSYTAPSSLNPSASVETSTLIIHTKTSSSTDLGNVPLRINRTGTSTNNFDGTTDNSGTHIADYNTGYNYDIELENILVGENISLPNELTYYNITNDCDAGAECTTNTTDYSYCSAANSCVYKETCYAHGYTGSVGGDFTGECTTNTWYVYDTNSEPITKINTTINNTYTQDQTPSISFNFTDDSTTNNCTLYFNNTAYGQNSTTQNNTQTTITANETINDGNYSIYVNCSDGTKIGQSGTINLIIDTTTPTINIEEPINNGGLANSATFNYNVTEIFGLANCELIINGEINETDTSITTQTTQTFNQNNLQYQEYNWSINCTDNTGNKANTNTLKVHIINTTYTGSQATNLKQTDVTNITNFTLHNENKGKIKFLGTTNLSGIENLGSYLIINTNTIYLDATNLPTLNKTAELTINSPNTQPIIMKNGVRCTDCTIIEQQGQNITFNVTGFSNYTTSENTSLLIWDNNENNASLYQGTATTYINEETNFYANYTNASSGQIITSATCNISFNDSTSYIMTYDATPKLYKKGKTFTQTGNYTYNVTCSKTNYAEITLEDNITLDINAVVSQTYILPATPTTNDNLYGYCNATDETEEITGFYYKVYKNNALYENSSLLWKDTITSGRYHACGIRANDSRVLCWGDGGNGRRGDGTTTDVNTPTLINDTSAYITVSAGYSHTCGIRANDSRVLCWGYNPDGRLGTGDITQRENPTLINDTSKYTYIYSGNYHTCGLTNNGTAKCWGMNDYGQVGDGTEDIDKLNPTTINTEANFTDIMAGNTHSCGIRANDSRILCWGSNTAGRLGDGTTTQRNDPTLINSTAEYSNLGIGWYHTCAIRTNDSRVVCWGEGSTGRLGTGSETDQYNPTETTDTSAYKLIRAGNRATCGILTNGTAKCWGENNAGELGDGTTGTDRTNPTEINDVSTYKQINPGLNNTCAVTSEGYVKCWGSNLFGALGDGTYTDHINPASITTNYKYSYINKDEVILATIDNSKTTLDDEWKLSCKAITQTKETAWKNSTAVTIQTLEPEVGSITLYSEINQNSSVENLYCNTIITDPQADNMNATVKWYKNNILNLTIDYNNSYSSGSPFEPILNQQNTTKNDIWKCSIQATDGTYNSEWTNSSNLTIINTPPSTTTHTINASAGTNKTDENLSCFVTINDVDQDQINITMNWYKNTVLNSTTIFENKNSGQTAQINLSSTLTTKEDTWICGTTLTDGDITTTEQNISLTIQNSNPILQTTTLLPTIAESENDLYGYCNASDIDQENVTYYWKTYKNDVLNESSSAEHMQGTEINIHNISNSITQATDTWILSCLASDGTINTSWMNSSQITIQESAPNIGSITINTTNGNNKTNENITCSTTITDPQTDPMNITTKWYKNNNLQLTINDNQNYQNGTQINQTLNYANTTKNDIWKCSIQATDGTHTSTWTNSSNITITNTPPSITTRIIPAIPQTTDDLASYCNATDPDGDTITYNYKWYKDGSLEKETGIVTYTYQEDADSIYYTSNWWSNDAYGDGLVTDGSQITSDYGSPSAYLYMNYSKPINALNTSIWQINDYESTTTPHNISIPADCFNIEPMEFRLLSALSGLDTSWECKNSSGSWVQARFYENFVVYEEGIFWNTTLQEITRTANTEINLNNISSADTALTEQWIISCQASDGTDTTNWINSSIATISNPNTPPNATSIKLNTTDNQNATWQDLKCTANLEDIDQNNINVTINWYKNGILDQTRYYNNSYSNGTQFNATLLSGNITEGENWICGIILTDGTNTSQEQNSTALTVRLPCGTLNEIRTYTMTENITETTNNCYEINATDITLNCNGYTITGAKQSNKAAILTTKNNTLIKNCYINNMSNGISATYDENIIAPSNIIITNNTIINTLRSIDIDNVEQDISKNITITYNNITSNNADFGIRTRQYVENSNISFNTITIENGTSVQGIDLDQEYVSYGNNTIANNEIIVNGTNAIGIKLRAYPTDDIINNNRITTYQTNAIGIQLYMGIANSIIENNTINSEGKGIELDANFEPSFNNLIINNTINSTKTHISILNEYANNNIIYHNNLTGSGQWINNSNITNQFNTTINSIAQGNHYPNTTSYTLYDSDADGWGDIGNDYPFNQTTLGINLWEGPGADFGPATTKEEINNPPNTPTPNINSTDGTNYTTQNLNCWAIITDNDTNDKLNVTVNWYKDNTLNLTIDYNNSYDNGTQFNATLQSENTTKNDEWICGITLNDGTNTSQEGNSTTITIQNTEPTITSSRISPTPTAKPLKDLEGYCNATDLDGDNVTYIWQWYKNGELNSSGSQTETTYQITYQEDANQTLCTGTWNVPCANSVDGNWTTYSQSDTGSYSYMNYTKPSGVQETGTLWEVKDYSGTENLTLNTQCFAQTPIQLRGYSSSGGEHSWECYNGTTWNKLRNAFTGSWLYEEAIWWNITTQDTSYTTKGIEINVENISNTKTTEGDVWLLNCMANDGTENSTTTNSTPTTIQITPPNTPIVYINSTDGSNETSQDLNCWATITENNTNQKLNVTVNWYKDNTLNLTIDYNNSYDNGTQFNATLQSENTTKNDEWICGITLNDGTNTSQEGNSTALTIINTQPTIQTTIITPTTPQTNDTLYGYCNATDIDGDQIKYNYTWYKDDVVEFSSIGIKINSISAGSRHTCAIRTNDSRILCWGNNAYGQLGNGTSGGQTSNPQLINDTTQYKQISAGNDFTCGLTINNTVKCWGYNNGGQIGDGTTTQRNNPTLINDTAKYKYLDVGYEATCGILTNGTAKCWGNNYYGELGVGDTTNRTNPTAINDSATYKQISAGYDYTCGILTNGTAKCWGYNTNGELGLGHTTHQYNPITINDTTTYKQIDANYYNTCGILTNGTAKCWGSNSVGQVGDGTTTQKNNPTTINDTTTYLQIMGGADHTCGITNKGQVKCWGDDSSEQLGNGVQTENPNPTNTTDTSTYITITSGEYFSCGILRNGTTKCWGDGSSGQLGDGALSTNQDPTQINNANSFGTGYFDSGEQTLVSIINSEETTGNENWTLSCTPYDSQNYGAQTNTSIIIPATNTAPTITYVESISSQDPQESQNKSISITYTVTDTDGNETINVSSASTIFSKGAIERTNTSCISTNINSTSINITCTIQMTYYDEPGTWNINVSIQDNSAAYVENTTTTMTYNELSAISLNVNEITFGTANIGQENVSGTTLIVNNTGNVNFTQIQIKGYDLTNETNTISAGNITVNVTDSSIGQQIINNTLINITNAQLIKQTIEQIYFYIDVPNIVLPAKQYNSMQPWTIIAEK